MKLWSYLQFVFNLKIFIEYLRLLEIICPTPDTLDMADTCVHASSLGEKFSEDTKLRAIPPS